MKRLLLFLSIIATNVFFAQDGTIDPSYNTGTGFVSDAYDSILFSDDKLLVVGGFSTYNGTTVNGIVKLNTDGTIDSSFSGGTAVNTTGGSYLFCSALQSDGKILVGGSFTSFNGTTRNRIARLNADGSVDTSFDVGTLIANNFVTKIVVQADGKILVMGAFTGTHNRIIRLNADGSLDSSFTTGTGCNNTTLSAYELSDGKILLSGSFDTYNSTSVPASIIRLNSNGTLDTTFNPAGAGGDNSIDNIILQSDGKIIISGVLANYNGTAVNRIARLNADGTLDTSFNTGTGTSAAIRHMNKTPDGKYFISGDFTSYNGTSRNRIARLNADGSLDTSFQPGTGLNSRARAVRVQSDNKIVLVGGFSTYNGVTVNRIVRVGDISLSTPSNQFSTEFTHFPNPINDELFFESSSNGKIEIYDVNGRFILEQNLTIGNTKIDCNGVSSGIYFGKVTNDKNETKTVKLIKK